ncbi:PREDICTED: transcription factor Adf-1-like [Amphimedon queenslandica]|uniref:MADF domain-containing protein n=1 Tax=Amphimedon queenslandica TaxID=400682 RepID=A0AAN0J096_AMPQE|nr:PREDICTED: transcription factor Adf-1-like [Amphimedon queenslandica]|eukprot:XP_019850435.1 PREDICTED: transcription factor Adf-1-like [Amphimedon queenslandica]
MADEKLIEAVRDFPCLWQLSTRAYKDIRAKEKAWKIVADKVGEGCSVDDCSMKWKSLRNKFVREIKKVKKRKTGEEGPVYVSCWPLFN